MKTLLKYMTALLCSAVLLPACSTDPFITYEDRNGIYFDAFTEKRPRKVPNELKYTYQSTRVDSLRYSFLMDDADEDKATDTVWVNIKVNGVAPGQDLPYRIEAAPSSTAVAGKHYTNLAAVYTFHAGLYVDSLPIVFHKAAMPAKGSVRLVLNLVADAGMPPVLEEHRQVILNVSNDYFKPWYWDQYVDFNLKYYHPFKLEKIWEVLGTKKVAEWRMSHPQVDWDTEVGGTCYWYFKNGNITDENGDRVTVD